MKKKPHGGKRKGAGRPAKEPTTTIRVPAAMVDAIKKLIMSKLNTQFKTLVFKGDRSKILGMYAFPIQLDGDKYEWGGCDVPLLMTKETTIENLLSLYNGLSFKEVNLINIKICL